MRSQKFGQGRNGANSVLSRRSKVGPLHPHIADITQRRIRQMEDQIQTQLDVASQQQKQLQDQRELKQQLDNVENGTLWEYPTAPKAATASSRPGSLSDVFLVPNKEQARERLIESYTNLLQERNHNERFFRLP